MTACTNMQMSIKNKLKPFLHPLRPDVEVVLDIKSSFHAEASKDSAWPVEQEHWVNIIQGKDIKVLKEHAAGLSASELCRKYGISDATFYKWRSRYGGMEISDARKLKALEEENRKLKKLLAETMLDASTLKEMLGKNF